MSIVVAPARRGRPRGSEARELVFVARREFIAHGYRGTTMESVAAQAQVSKQSFTGSTARRTCSMPPSCGTGWAAAYDAMRPHTTALAEAHQVRQGLLGLARVLQAGLLSPPVLQMRILIAAEAQRFPDVAGDYVTRSWARNLGMLADALHALAARGLLHIGDPDLAAEQLTWLGGGRPLNRLTLQAGDNPYSPDELEAHGSGPDRPAIDGVARHARPTSQPSAARGAGKPRQVRRASAGWAEVAYTHPETRQAYLDRNEIPWLPSTLWGSSLSFQRS